MNKETVEDFKKKHFENYKTAVIEILKNNTISLFEDDILSLLKTPPLDSMDIIKCKFLDIAKRHKIVIQSESLENLLQSYRTDIISFLSEWERMRIDFLINLVTSFTPKKETDVIKFNKKDFSLLNRKLKKDMKLRIKESVEKNIVNNVNKLFTKVTDDNAFTTISTEMIRFVQNTYIKQLLEGIDFKVIVKDTTLMNGIREQGERYLFTKMNSHLLKED